MANVIVSPDATAAQTFDALASKVYMAILENDPTINWLMQGPASGMDETQTFKWTDEIRTETTGVLNENITASDTNLVLVSTADFRAQDHIWIAGHRDTNDLQIVWRVTVVVDATNLTVVQIKGADTTLTHSSNIVHRTAGTLDNEKPTSSEVMPGMDEPTVRENVFQIFRETIEMGEVATMLANSGQMYGVNGPNAAEARTMQQALYRMIYKEYHAFTRGVKQAATSSLPGMMDGLFSFVNTTTNTARKNAGGNALVTADINDAMENLANNGLPKNSEMVMLMSPTNARVLSAAKNTQIAYPSNQANGALGGSVQTFLHDLPEWPGVRIIVDRDMDDFFVPILARQFMNRVPAAGKPAITVQDATVPGQLGTRKILRSWSSLQVEGAENYHTVIHNIVP